MEEVYLYCGPGTSQFCVQQTAAMLTSWCRAPALLAGREQLLAALAGPAARTGSRLLGKEELFHQLESSFTGTENIYLK